NGARRCGKSCPDRQGRAATGGPGGVPGLGRPPGGGGAPPCRTSTPDPGPPAMGFAPLSPPPQGGKGRPASTPPPPPPSTPPSPLARPQPEGLREFSPRAILCGLFVAAVLGVVLATLEFQVKDKTFTPSPTGIGIGG